MKILLAITVMIIFYTENNNHTQKGLTIQPAFFEYLQLHSFK